MARGFVHLVAVVVLRQARDEGFGRKVLSRRVALTIAAGAEARTKPGLPDIFTTDQARRFPRAARECRQGTAPAQ